MDLYEIKAWPVEKKLVYQEHMLAEAQLQQQYQGDDMEMPDMGGMGNPKQAMGKARSMGGKMPSGSPRGGGGGGSTEATQHPALAKYGNVVNVSGDD